MSNNTLGERIKHHRKRLNLTQEQLAERLGVSAQAVSKWENNLACPDISILPVLAGLFGISVDELLGLKTTETPPVHEAEVIDTSGKDAKKRGKSALRKKISSLLFAFYILTCGALMLVNNYCGFDVSWWTVLWTLGLTYLGVSIMKFSILNIAITATGVYFLLSAYEVLPFKLGWSVVLPGVLLLWGLSLLIDIFFGKKSIPLFTVTRTNKHGTRKSNDEPRCEYRCDGGYLHCDLSVGEHRTAVVTPLLRGGDIDASFGSFSVDFSGCEAVAHDCTIEVDNSFGSLTLLVPNRFKVNIAEDDAFAAHVEFDGAPMEHPQGILNIELDNNFGTVTIRYID